VEQELTDPDSIGELTDADLKELGVSTLGARKKFIAAIARLREAHGLSSE